jgi:UDP-2,3-diacylglucosamine pyrophosphatase LpxH
MGRTKKRYVELVVLSDIHLGTFGCHAEELLRYLKSIKPGRVILNGDIIDMWQFSKRYWPATHMQVIKHITGLLTRNTKVTYLTGNHDEMLRRFAGFKLGSFRIDNKAVVSIQGKKAWFFHGDVFDVTMKHSRWLARCGALGYDTLILLNTFVNACLKAVGREKISLSKRVKDSVKSAIRFIGDFEQTAAEIAIDSGYDYVVCGHIHKPEIKKICTGKGEVMYLNSGDWVENLTALEYDGKEWRIYRYSEDLQTQSIKLPLRLLRGVSDKQLLNNFISQVMTAKR